MANVSQENLIKLSEEAKSKGNLEQSVNYLDEALRLGHDKQIVLALCDDYLQLKQNRAAYKLIKEEKDLFSDRQIFHKYLQVLQHIHYRIEFLQLEHLVGQKLAVQVDPVSEDRQEKIMGAFKQESKINSQIYQTLYSLSEQNFVQFAQSCLIDPSTDFTVRIALCEDLVKMGADQTIKVIVLDKQAEFNPRHTPLMSHDPVYRQVITQLASSYDESPSQLPNVLGEANLVLAALYPQLQEYIPDPASFASNLDRFMTRHDGGADQKLLEKVYRHLPKEA